MQRGTFLPPTPEDLLSITDHGHRGTLVSSALKQQHAIQTHLDHCNRSHTRLGTA